MSLFCRTMAGYMRPAIVRQTTDIYRRFFDLGCIIDAHCLSEEVIRVFAIALVELGLVREFSSRDTINFVLMMKYEMSFDNLSMEYEYFNTITIYIIHKPTTGVSYIYFNHIHLHQ